MLLKHVGFPVIKHCHFALYDNDASVLKLSLEAVKNKVLIIRCDLILSQYCYFIGLYYTKE